MRGLVGAKVALAFSHLDAIFIFNATGVRRANAG